MRRPRTEARVRRLGDARGIDKSRPVTEVAARYRSRGPLQKAKVALARKLAVVLHRMWVSASTFDFEKANGCTRAAA